MTISGARPEIIPGDWHLWSEVKPSVIWPLGGGLTNENFLIAVGTEKLVLRKNSAISKALDLNRGIEAQVLRHADSAGLCAPVIYCDPDYRYLVTRYLEGKLWRARNVEDIVRLAQLLRRIHTLPPVDARLDVRVKIARYWRSIDQRADFYSDLKMLRQSVLAKVDAVQSLNRADCLCHNDLSPANLIAANDGNLYVIDWEYTAMGDPFFELALIIEEHGLGTEQQQLLMAEYLQRPIQEVDTHRLCHWRAIYSYLSLLWYAVQWSNGTMREAAIEERIHNTIRDLKNR